MDLLPVRISSKIIKHKSGCWLWQNALDRHGYGVVSWKGNARRAHRVVYFLIVGETELSLDHLCRVHNCVNPEHLEPVTTQENIRRGEAGKYQKEKWSKPRLCPQGHLIAGENMYAHYSQRLKRINRQCRTCKRESKRRRRLAGSID